MSTVIRIDPPVVLAPEYPVIPVTNISVTAATLREVGAINWMDAGNIVDISADVALPNLEMMIMVERIVSGNTAVGDIRRPATIFNGRLSLQFNPKISGNYLLSAERLNVGLAEIGAPFQVAFDKVEFDVIDPL
jgi:hypothetical protein